jgi:hypothetical protein
MPEPPRLGTCLGDLAPSQNSPGAMGVCQHYSDGRSLLGMDRRFVSRRRRWSPRRIAMYFRQSVSQIYETVTNSTLINKTAQKLGSKLK